MTKSFLLGKRDIRTFVALLGIHPLVFFLPLDLLNTTCFHEMDYFSGQIPGQDCQFGHSYDSKKIEFQPGGQGQSSMKNIGSWNWKIFQSSSSRPAC